MRRTKQIAELLPAQKVVAWVSMVLFAYSILAVIVFVARQFSWHEVMRELPFALVWPVNLLHIFASVLYIIRVNMLLRGSVSLGFRRFVWISLFYVTPALWLAWQAHEFEPTIDPYLNLPHSAWILSICLVLFLMSTERGVREIQDDGGAVA